MKEKRSLLSGALRPRREVQHIRSLAHCYKIGFLPCYHITHALVNACFSSIGHWTVDSIDSHVKTTFGKLSFWLSPIIGKWMVCR